MTFEEMLDRAMAAPAQKSSGLYFPEHEAIGGGA
jgi:hypothetical protein